MRKVTIKMAGTSSGGSSYLNRVMKAVDRSPLGTEIEIVVGLGSHQKRVFDMVSRQCELLERITSKISRKKCSFSYSVALEHHTHPYIRRG